MAEKIKKVYGGRPIPARFRDLDQQRRNIQKVLDQIPAASDEQIKVTSGDLVAGYLEQKITFDSQYFEVEVIDEGGNQILLVKPLVDNTTEVSTALAVTNVESWMAGKYVEFSFTGIPAPRSILIQDEATEDIDVGSECTFFLNEDAGGAAITIDLAVGVEAKWFSGAGGAINQTGPGVGAQFAGLYTAITIKKIDSDLWHIIGNIA